MSYIILDCETLSQPEASIRLIHPEWSEEEAKTRVPKNYKQESAISDWLKKDQETYWSKILDDAALHAETAFIAVVGIMNPDHTGIQYCMDEEGGEKRMLERAWAGIQQSIWDNLHITGWNVIGFDLSMMVKRSWALNVQVPSTIFQPTSRYPFGDRVLDLQAVFSAGRFEDKNTKLDKALKMLGLPAKTGSGKDFQKLWLSDRNAALDYNLNDLMLEHAISVRLGVNEAVQAEAEEELP